MRSMNRKRIKEWTRLNGRVVFIYSLLVIELIAASIISPVFATPRNMSNVLLQLVVLGIVSLGQTFPLLTGAIDLSVGSVIGLALALSTLWAPENTPGVVAFGIGIIFVGAIIGLINATLIIRGRLNFFIVTLATLSVVQGIVLLIRPVPSGIVPRQFQQFSLGRIWLIPLPVVLLVVLVALGQGMLTQTRFGRHLFAIGGNEENAALSGVRVATIKSGAFVMCSSLAALGGLMLAGILGSADPLVGEYYPLESITAAVLGGVGLTGGEGNLFGVLAGVMFITVLRNAMNLVGVRSFYQLVAVGTILIVAMAIFSIQARR